MKDSVRVGSSPAVRIDGTPSALHCLKKGANIDPLHTKFNGQVPGPGIIPSISSFLTLLILIFKRKP